MEEDIPEDGSALPPPQAGDLLFAPFRHFLRAQQLLDPLRDVVARYMQSVPVLIEAGPPTEDGYPTLVLSRFEDIPDLVHNLFGEIIYHLRSALDNLAFTIATTNPGSTPEPEKAAWPIYDRDEEFDLGRNAKKLQRFHPDDLKQIRMLKGTGDGAANLWVLHNLNNLDKHRSPIAAKLYEPWARAVSMAFTDEAGNVIGGVEFKEGPWTKGQIIGRGVTKNMVDITMGAPTSIELTLPGDNGTLPIFDLLDRLGTAVYIAFQAFNKRQQDPTFFKTMTQVPDSMVGSKEDPKVSFVEFRLR